WAAAARVVVIALAGLGAGMGLAETVARTAARMALAGRTAQAAAGMALGGRGRRMPRPWRWYRCWMGGGWSAGRPLPTYAATSPAWPRSPSRPGCAPRWRPAERAQNF